MADSRSSRSTGAASCRGASRLTRDQKREFALGWLNWLGAESLGVVVAMLNIVWVPVVAFLDIAVPDRILTIPIIASFAVSLLHFVTLYRLRVRNGPGQLARLGVRRHVGAMDGGARGRLRPDQGSPAVRAHRQRRRCGARPISTPSGKRCWRACLSLGAVVLVATNIKQVREINIFAVVLVVQSLPFIAAVGLAVFERTRLNDFAYLARHSMRALGELIARRAAAGARSRADRQRTQRTGAVGDRFHLRPRLSEISR